MYGPVDPDIVSDAKTMSPFPAPGVLFSEVPTELPSAATVGLHVAIKKKPAPMTTVRE